MAAVRAGLDPARSGGGRRKVPRDQGDHGKARLWFPDGVLGRRCVVAVVVRLELAAAFVLDGEPVWGSDLIAQVVNQFEHGEGGLPAPAT